MNKKSTSVLLALVGALILAAGPPSASASKYNRPDNQKLGISESLGRFPDGVVPWVYNPTGKPAVFSSNAYFVGLLQDAMEEIAGVSGLTFDYQGIDSNVVLDDYSDDVVAVGWEFLGGAAGLAGPRSSCSGQDVIDLGYCQYVDGRVRFNTATDWDTGVTDFTERDFRQVAVHELLHLVGIGHSEKQISVMYADPYNNLSQLREDDIEGLQSLYGEPDEFTQVPIYLPPAAGPSPLTDSFISTNLDIGSEVTEVDGNEAATFIGVSWKAAAPYSDDVTIVATDPHGYYYAGKLDDRDCGGGICTFWTSFATMEVLFTFPGVWTVYLIVDGDLVETESVTVTTSPTYNEAPDSTFEADVVYGPAPLTVNMTLAVTGDNEGDAVSASWHIPTVGEEELDSGNFPGSAGVSERSVTFDTPGEYEIYTAVNDDWARYGSPQNGDDAGPGFRKLYRTVVRVTKVADDITSIADGTQVGTHVGGPNSKPKIKVYSTVDGSVETTLRFLTFNWRGLAVSTVRDANQNGTANDPALALLADHKNTAKIAVEIRRVNNGNKLRKINFRNANWRAIDVVVINDMNGNGNTNDTAIGVLAQHRTNGKIMVEIRKLSDGSHVRNIVYASAKWHAIAAAVIDRSPQSANNITPYIAVLLENPQTGKRRIESRRLGNGGLNRLIPIFGAMWDVKDLTAVHDVNGNGVMNDPGWQVLAIRKSDDLVRIQTRLASNGNFVSNRQVLTPKWEGLRLDSSPDVNNNGTQEFLVALKQRVSGQRRMHIKDYDTGGLIRNITP